MDAESFRVYVLSFALLEKRQAEAVAVSPAFADVDAFVRGLDDALYYAVHGAVTDLRQFAAARHKTYFSWNYAAQEFISAYNSSGSQTQERVRVLLFSDASSDVSIPPQLREAIKTIDSVCDRLALVSKCVPA